MGDVFLARARVDLEEQWVAIKRVHPGLLQQPGIRERFEREAEICGLLQHPNIVALRAHGADRSGPYLAFEFVKGASAATLIQWSAANGRQLPVRTVLLIARDCARALDHAHRQASRGDHRAPVIHRDVSPDNVLVSEEGVAKLSDFGISQLVGRTTIGSGSLKGKIGYLAPELFRGGDASCASDVFSFCVTLFELLCGVLPFRGRHDAELITAVLSAQPPELQRLRPELPGTVASWIHAGLGKMPAERPPDFSALLSALESALGPDEAAARAELAACVRAAAARTLGADAAEVADAPRTRAWRPEVTGRRSARLKAAVAAAVAALVLVAATGWRIYRGASDVPAIEAVATAPGANDAPIEPSKKAAEPPEQTPRSASVNRDAPATVQQRVSGAVQSDRDSESGRDRGALSVSQPVKAGTGTGVGVADGTRRKDARRTRPPASRRTTQTAPEAPGHLRLRIHPWAEVFIDGRRHGVTPLPVVALSPGVHSVILVNPELGVRRAHQVRIEAGREALLKAVLSGDAAH